MQCLLQLNLQPVRRLQFEQLIYVHSHRFAFAVTGEYIRLVALSHVNVGTSKFI